MTSRLVETLDRRAVTIELDQTARCVICDELITEDDVDNHDAVVIRAREARLFTHKSHFFKDAAGNRPTADYQRNAQILSRAYTLANETGGEA